jgi:hypothetical protein
MLAVSESYQNYQNGAIRVENLTPRVFPLSASAHTWDSNSCPPDQELGALSKWLVGGMVV